MSLKGLVGVSKKKREENIAYGKPWKKGLYDFGK